MPAATVQKITGPMTSLISAMKVAQRLEVDTDLRPQPADKGAEHDANQHLHIDRF